MLPLNDEIFCTISDEISERHNRLLHKQSLITMPTPLY